MITNRLFQDIEVAVTRTVHQNYRMWWSRIDIDHETATYDKNYRKELQSKLSKMSGKGLYIYEFEDPITKEVKTLYVGKSKELPARLFNHYKERHRQTGHPKWRDFWSSYPHKMTVYVQDVGHEDDKLLDEACRIISERYFIVKLNPISELTYKSVK
jgi:hypothetical protein